MSEQDKKAQNAGKTFDDTPGVGPGEDKGAPPPAKDTPVDKVPGG